MFTGLPVPFYSKMRRELTSKQVLKHQYHLNCVGWPYRRLFIKVHRQYPQYNRSSVATCFTLTSPLISIHPRFRCTPCKLQKRTIFFKIKSLLNSVHLRKRNIASSLGFCCSEQKYPTERLWPMTVRSMRSSK